MNDPEEWVKPPWLLDLHTYDIPFIFAGQSSLPLRGLYFAHDILHRKWTVDLLSFASFGALTVSDRQVVARIVRYCDKNPEDRKMLMVLLSVHETLPGYRAVIMDFAIERGLMDADTVL